MAQNVYDRDDFFNAYMTLIDRSSKENDLATDPAWTRLAPLMPDVKDLDILDLGCGSGWFCRWAINNDAKSVLGIDISEKMLGKAAEFSADKYPAIEYRRADIDTLTLPDEDSGKYGLVFSSLTLHYLENLHDIMALMHRVLKPGASFVFNVEHPIYTAPRKPGVVKDPDSGDDCWAFNSYYKEGERTIDWLAKGIRKQHRTITTYMDIIFKTGFDVTGFVEFLPTAQELESGDVDPIEGLRPLFLMMSVRKRA